MNSKFLKISLFVGLLAVQVPAIAQSTPRTYSCRGTVQANPANNRVSFTLEFTYTPSRPQADLNISLKEPSTPKATSRKAYFSTDGETSYWTIPVVKGVAPIVIARFPARTEAAASWVAGFSGYSESPMKCKPL